MLTVGAVAVMVLLSECDTGPTERDQPMVRVDDAVGVARQICEHAFRRGERRFGADEPPPITERPQVAEEGTSVAQAGVVTRSKGAGPSRSDECWA